MADQFRYDVFLSFRGEDTRRSFVDHLCQALTKNGITFFKDDDKRDWNVSSKSIAESRFATVLFSKSYISSSWCLDELVEIMNCRNRNEQFVLPVYYYDFNPSYLRNHGSNFGELFAKYDMEKVSTWTSALVEAANLSGFGLTDYRYQGKHITDITKLFLNKLNPGNVNFTHNSIQTEIMHDFRDATSSHEKLIGMERCVHHVKTLLQGETVKTTRRTYDVFMCYNGIGTSKDFGHQLHCALKLQGICPFINDIGLAIDELVSSEYLKAIKESYVALVVLSKNYVASSSCLDELAMIMNYNEEFGKTVVPVYFDVDSCDLRNQIGYFWESVMRNEPGKEQVWRKALVKAGSLAGWYMNGTPKSLEAPIISSIVDFTSRRLVSTNVDDDNRIGIEVRLKHLMPLLELETGGVRVIGITGMGGIGKTTLARAVFDRISADFDTSCFVDDIRERSKKYGLELIQAIVLAKKQKTRVRNVAEGNNLIKQYFGDIKLLMVLDDVNHVSQLEALVGGRNWFGDGSRIIITARAENVLLAPNMVDKYYRVKALDDNESMNFVTRYAFKKSEFITKEYEKDLIPQVINYASGLPLALKVLSLKLCGKTNKEWTNIVDRLKVYPEKEIQDRLKISYDDDLHDDDDVKNIFLYVACFFNGMEKEKVVSILDSVGYSGDNGITLLVQKSFISISTNGCIFMHPLLQQMARDIVRRQMLHPKPCHADDEFNHKMGTKDPGDLTEALRGYPRVKRHGS